MSLIKSKSTFIIKSKHQNTKKGTIYERDYTTLGGISTYPSKQHPIYSSGNLLITTGEANRNTKSYLPNGWYGDVWSLDEMRDENFASTNEDPNIDLILKLDYYTFQDFAYYGSATELVRGSINDAISKFPGELYAPIESDSGLEVYFSFNNATVRLGGVTSPKFLLDNPFNIDLHTKWVESQEASLKYFANEGWKNYQIVKGEKTYKITSFENKTGDIEDICLGDGLGELKLYYDEGGTSNVMTIYPYLSNNGILYLVKEADLEIGIRPKVEFIEEFYDSLDGFERVILNPKSSPKYKCTFEVLSETSYGYSTMLTDFIYPTTYGGYNIATNGPALDAYITQFYNATSLYDELYSDNIYRNLTHESIKNFDWTNWRDEDNDEAEEIQAGSSRIANMLRLIGREFDEVKLYVQAISDNEDSAISDYELTDANELEGWDLRNIYTLVMNEVDASGTSVSDQLNYAKRLRNASGVSRTFNDNLNYTVLPFSKGGMTDYYGYTFKTPVACEPAQRAIERKDGKNYYIGSQIDGETITYNYYPLEVHAIENIGENYYLDKNAGEIPVLRNRIIEYFSDKEYTCSESNNIFFRNLKKFSRGIISQKGTKGGVEAILSLFGLHSKDWVDALTETQKEHYKLRYASDTNNAAFGGLEDWQVNLIDFDITERVCFTNGLTDYMRTDKGMHAIDWYNSTKLISYNTVDGMYDSYAGLPLAIYENGDDNLLYPYFDPEEELDGKMYYQMNGGWLNRKPFAFDSSNNLIKTNENIKAYEETARKIYAVDSLKNLVDGSSDKSHNGEIFYVKDLATEYLIIDGIMHEVYTEQALKDGVPTNTLLKYVKFSVSHNTMFVNSYLFEENVTVTNPYYEDYLHTTWFSDNAFDLKAYILPYDYMGKTVSDVFDEQYANGKLYTSPSLSAYTYGVLIYNDDISISDSLFFHNGSSYANGTENVTNYFKLQDTEFADEISENGWVQMLTTDEDYYKINYNKNYFKGNNPHTSEVESDSGKEYISFFSSLFRYAYSNDLFDVRCYQDGNNNTYDFHLENIRNIGFHALDDNWDTQCKLDYNSYDDSKIHYFGDLIELGEKKRKYVSYPKEFDKEDLQKYISNGCKLYNIFDTFQISTANDFEVKGLGEGNNEFEYAYVTGKTPFGYTINDVDGTTILASSAPINGVSDQIVNTKLLTITFYLHRIGKEKDWGGKKDYRDTASYMEQVAYLDKVVVPFMTQLVPSTSILTVEYQPTWQTDDLILEKDMLYYDYTGGTLSSAIQGINLNNITFENYPEWITPQYSEGEIKFTVGRNPYDVYRRAENILVTNGNAEAYITIEQGIKPYLEFITPTIEVSYSTTEAIAELVKSSNIESWDYIRIECIDTAQTWCRITENPDINGDVQLTISAYEGTAITGDRMTEIKAYLISDEEIYTTCQIIQHPQELHPSMYFRPSSVTVQYNETAYETYLVTSDVTGEITFTPSSTALTVEYSEATGKVELTFPENIYGEDDIVYTLTATANDVEAIFTLTQKPYENKSLRFEPAEYYAAYPATSISCYVTIAGISPESVELLTDSTISASSGTFVDNKLKFDLTFDVNEGDSKIEKTLTAQTLDGKYTGQATLGRGFVKVGFSQPAATIGYDTESLTGVSITIDGDITYDDVLINEECDWVTSSPIGEDGSVIFNIEKNEGSASRTCIISACAKDKCSTFTLTQEAFDGSVKILYTTVSDNPFTGLAKNAFIDGTQSVAYAIMPTKIDDKYEIRLQTSNSGLTLAADVFKGKTDLETIIFPSNFSTLGGKSFSGCTNLTSISATNVTNVGNSAFEKCVKLSSINMPKLATINDRSFAYCESLTALPSTNITFIGDSAFTHCIGITSINLNKCSTMETYAFQYCTSLTGITFGTTLTTVNVGTFKGCSGLETITITNNITSIGDYAFSECPNVYKLDIASSVTKIGVQAFAEMTALEKNPDGVYIHYTEGNVTYFNTSAENDAFKGVDKETTLLHGDSDTLEEYYRISCQGWKDFDFKMKFADTAVSAACFGVTDWDIYSYGLLSYHEVAKVKTLNNLFKGNTSITQFNELYYFTSLKLIDLDFDSCLNLSAITLPPQVDIIPVSCFAYCTKLPWEESFKQVSQIDDSAFIQCGALTSITLGISLKRIGRSAFQACDNLTSVTFNTGLTTIDDYAFGGCGSLTGVTLDGTYKKIGLGAFSGCSSLTKVDIETGCEIGEMAFADNENTYQVIIKATSASTIGRAAFSGCTALAHQPHDYHYDNNTKVDDVMKLSTYSIIISGSGNVEIKDHAFSYIDRSGIDGSRTMMSVSAYCTTIALGKNVTRIGTEAFAWCPYRVVRCYATVPPTLDTAARLFYRLDGDKDNYKNLRIPKGCQSAYEKAWNYHTKDVRDNFSGTYDNVNDLPQ